jgi:thiosulfate dehydrogenase (quinone) large subunit
MVDKIIKLVMRKIILFLLRISLGWFMFYAGITKILNPSWSAEGYLRNAKLFTDFYGWLASPNIIGITNFLNAWGLTLLGVSLILGIFVKYSAALGAMLMLLYYLPLGIIHPDTNSFIVDSHVIYALLLTYLSVSRSGKIWGIDARLTS